MEGQDVHELASYPSCWRITIPPFEGLLSLRPEGRLATGKGKGRLWRILVRPSEPLYICVVLTNGQISFRGTPIDNDILCPSFIPFNHLPFCLAVSRSFLVHSCSFVPPLYIRGEEQNHRNKCSASERKDDVSRIHDVLPRLLELLRPSPPRHQDWILQVIWPVF